jgi:hypothetical protein
MTKTTKESYWQGRAEAFRAMAEQTSDPDSRSIAFDIAADLEKLGKAVGELSRTWSRNACVCVEAIEPGTTAVIASGATGPSHGS